MHVIETVDAQGTDVSVRKLVADVAVSALVLEQARITFGEEQTNAKLVYSATSFNEGLAKPSLLAAEHQGAELINWSSLDDRTKLITEMAQLAHPLSDKRKAFPVNSSLQHRFSLN
ncbi:hypothetical protein EAH87_10400 [Sphingomonas koreensis]|nr:hypothetical protein EAH87_10400 [Sphingomonas koreensis]